MTNASVRFIKHSSKSKTTKRGHLRHNLLRKKKPGSMCNKMTVHFNMLFSNLHFIIQSNSYNPNFSIVYLSGMHGGVVVSNVTSQQKGSWLLAWAFLCVLFKHYGFLPLAKNMHIRLINDFIIDPRSKCE